MVKFKAFSRPLSVFQVLFKANLIFKDFSRPVYSSTFQACANPSYHFNTVVMWFLFILQIFIFFHLSLHAEIFS